MFEPSSAMIPQAFWVCPPLSASTLNLPLAQVTALLEKLGQSDRHAVAEEVLRLLGPVVPLAQCAIFSFEGTGLSLIHI